MNQAGQHSYDAFRKLLTPRNLKEIQIIYFALGFGVVIFTVVLIFTYNLITQFVSDTDDTLIFILTLLHLVLLFAVIPLSKVLFTKILKSESFFKILAPYVEKQSEDSVDRSTWSLWYRIRLAHIIRLAVFESIAVFGLVICTLATFSGILQAYPLYWINLVSSLLFIVFLMNNFPTVDKLERFFREYVQGQSVYRGG